MKNQLITLSFSLFIATFFWACTPNNNGNSNPESTVSELTIFFVNDPHGRLDNFAKIKYIADETKESQNVIIACSGDIFSGNPVVDFYPEKGYPMIDVMNETGFDVSVIGNHEFDYGEEVLKARMEQADFEWVCANVDMMETGVPEPNEYITLAVDDLKVTFLGLVETYGKPGAVIPSSHPWKVRNYEFQPFESVVGNYADRKLKEDADLYVALSHLGHRSDFELAHNHPYFDLIIGGHSHYKIDTTVNSIPIFQAGSYLNSLGVIELKLKDKKVISTEFRLIDLNTYLDFDADLKAKIDNYNSMPELDEVIGFSEIHHNDNYNVGCFITDAFREQMNVDVSFINSGGIRDDLNEGDITKREIYAISPFNNGMMIYHMSVAEIKNFLISSRSGFYYSGFVLEQLDNEIVVKDLQGQILGDHVNLSIGINDYVPAVHEDLFPAEGEEQDLTDAETIITWLESIHYPISYPECDRYFRYQTAQYN